MVRPEFSELLELKVPLEHPVLLEKQVLKAQTV